MGGCCSSGTSAKYTQSPTGQPKDAAALNPGVASSPSVSCSACRLQQTIPATTSIFACLQCRHPLVNPGACPDPQWPNWTYEGVPELTVHSGHRPTPGSTVRLAPCCLYYDAQCVTLGCLDSLTEVGILINDSFLTGSEARPLEVEANNQKFQYKLGCIEDAAVVKLHDELFKQFAVSEVVGDKTVMMIGASQFCEFMKVTTHEEADLDVYGAICKALGVHPSQGLDSGDFRRMYSEFDGDLHEDHRLALLGEQPGSKDTNNAIKNV